MTWSIALNIGDAFAEVAAFRGDDVRHVRWFLPGLQFSKALADWLTSQNIEQVSAVRVSTSWVRTILHRQLSAPPAFLVTSGFESWIEMTSPHQKLLVDRDRVLGFNERTNADGSVFIEPKLEDLEFVASKLRLLKTNTVALGFLHSNKNPTNEDRAGDYLKEQGFKVFKSHELRSPSVDEKIRWSKTIERAYVEDLFKDWVTKLKTGLASFLAAEHEFLILGSSGFMTIDDITNPLETVQGPQLSAYRFANSKAAGLPATFFGFDEFFDQLLGPLAIQPLQSLVAGVFGIVTLDRRLVQVETGPMGWGRGQTATVLDILWKGGYLTQPQELLQRFSDRGSKRIDETLLALSRPLVSEERLSAEALLHLVLEGIREQLLDLSPRMATGPLAPSLYPLLPKGTKMDASAEGYEGCLGLYVEESR